MHKAEFLNEVDRRLRRLFKASHEGFSFPAAERHRLEGFMNAGIFLNLATKSELAARMELLHQEIFGMSIEQRRQQKGAAWQGEAIDYSCYEAPAYARRDGL